MGAWIKMSLFLELIWAHLCILIIRKKIFGEGPTPGLDDAALTAETIYPINFEELNKRLVLSLYYNGSNSFFRRI